MPEDIFEASLEELALLDNLENKLHRAKSSNAVKYRYRSQKMATKDLGIATPPRLVTLRNPLGWAASAIEVLQERIVWEGYTNPNNTEDDTTQWLNEQYHANFMLQQQGQIMDDALTIGCSYISLGRGGDGEADTIWRKENPNEMLGHFNQRTQELDYALKLQEYSDHVVATLWLPNSTLILERYETNTSEPGKWYIVERDDHNLGCVTIIPIINNPSTENPFGETEITPSLKGFVDSGMRTLLAAEVSREMYAKPLRAMIGTAEEDFYDEDGKPTHNWSDVAGTIINVPYNERLSQNPTITQFNPSDPSVILDMIEYYARLAAREIGVPPSYFGFESVNPSSADAIKVSENKLILKANSRIPYLKQAYKLAAKYSLLLAGKEMPEDFTSIEAVFRRTDTTTPQAAADRLSKMAAMGLFDKVFPPFVYRELGLTDLEMKETINYVKQNAGVGLIETLIAGNTPSTTLTDTTTVEE